MWTSDWNHQNIPFFLPFPPLALASLVLRVEAAFGILRLCEERKVCKNVGDVSEDEHCALGKSEGEKIGLLIGAGQLSSLDLRSLCDRSQPDAPRLTSWTATAR